MKITKDKNGKFIIDFEGLEIDVSDISEDTTRDKKVVKINLAYNCTDGGLGLCQSLWNDDVVSEVRNGVWNFGKNRIFTDIFQKGSHRPTESPGHVYCTRGDSSTLAECLLL